MKKTDLAKLGKQFLAIINNVKTKCELREMFHELSFQRVSSTGDAYLNRKSGYVVKFCLICDSHKPKWAIPTFSCDLPRDNRNRVRKIFPKKAGFFMVQPLADTSQKAINKFEIKANHEKIDWSFELIGGDCHAGNYGVYKGKPVVFDW